MAAERTEGLTKTFVAGGVINDARIVIFGSDDDTVVQAANATTRSIGVTTIPQGQEHPTPYGVAHSAVAAAIGDRVDVIMGGIADVVYGGTVARGDFLTADSTGRAVSVTLPPATATHIIGIATVSGAANEFGCVLIQPSYSRGA